MVTLLSFLLNPSKQKVLFFFSLFMMSVLGRCEAESKIYSETDPTLLVSQIEDNGLKTTFHYDSSKQCTAIFREYQKTLISRHFYSYDEQGYLAQVICDNGQGEEPNDLVGMTQRQVIRLQVGQQSPLMGKPLKIETNYWDSQSSEELRDEITLFYDSEGELVSMVDSQGKIAINVDLSSISPSDYSQQSALPPDPFAENLSLHQIWDSLVKTFFSGFQYFQLSAHQAKMKWNAELKLPEPISHILEKIGKTLVGEPTYLLMGPHFEETYVHCYGQREISDKVRVTFINGILNTRSMLLQTLDTVSDSHGGVKVHYVFRPTEGWTWDISRAIAIKTAYATLGFRSLHAHLLAQMWKELIEEMGGVEGGGVIMHYAHSLGGSETDRARELLSPEEQKMIRVVTFGSSTLVRSGGYQSVVNHISVNDGVCSFILEPFGHVRNYFDSDTNVRFHGSLLRSPIWPTDHLLNGPTYGPILLDLGDKFLKEFTPRSS
jgi:hypothetical protein